MVFSSLLPQTRSITSPQRQIRFLRSISSTILEISNYSMAGRSENSTSAAASSSNSTSRNSSMGTSATKNSNGETTKSTSTANGNSSNIPSKIDHSPKIIAAVDSSKKMSPTKSKSPTESVPIDQSSRSPEKSTTATPKLTKNSNLSEKICVDRRQVYELLKSMADELRFYYSSIEPRATYGARFCQTSLIVWQSITESQPIIDSLALTADRYDFDARTPGNGVRSIVAILDSCILHLLKTYKEINEQRSGLLFRGNHYIKELEAYAGALVVLVKAVSRVHAYLHVWPEGELFVAKDEDDRKLRTLMAEIESLDQSPFYGRTMGFQFATSLLQVFQVIGISLASYSLLWDKKRPAAASISGAASNLLTSGNYLINPEERAKRIFHVTLNADIEFCKAFWNLTEGPLLQELPRWFSPNLALNEMWQIPGDLTLTLETLDGRQLEVPPPTAYSGPKNLPVRVMSVHYREGMPTPHAWFKTAASMPKVLPKSPTLIMHVHGGGFVATSSKTHEPYLRHWTKSLNCPVVSVDYSLAPEHPYPRASEEVYYAYAWVLANKDRLGWTGERICLAGDSAGGLLLASTTLKLIKRQVRRLPDGLVLIYPAFLAQYSPSPSRLLSLLDPLLPMGILTRCLAAYTGNIEYLKTDTPTADTSSTGQAAAQQSSKDESSESSPKDEQQQQGSSIFNIFKRQSPQQPKKDDREKQKSLEKSTNLATGAAELAVEAMEVVDGGEDPKKTKAKRPDFVLCTDEDEEDGITGNSKVGSSPSKSRPSEPDDARGIENLANEQRASDVRDFLHRQLSRTSQSDENRKRSRSDNIVGGQHDQKSNDDDHEPSQDCVSTDSGSMTSETVDESPDEESPTARRVAHDVPRDPRLIVFGVSNYDQAFFDYLRDHEMTSGSFRRVVNNPSRKSASMEKMESEPISTTVKPSETDDRSSSIKSQTVESQPSDSTSSTSTVQYARSQSSGSLATLGRASASIGHKMGLYVMDNLGGWFNPGATDVRGMFNNDGMVQQEKKTVNGEQQQQPTSPQCREGAHSERKLVLNSPLAKFHDMPVPKDPFLSPLLAPDAWLERFPKTSILACHLDPLLDDSVSFAKRLKRNGVDVSLDLVDSLPHGFLNFAMFSPECREAARICTQRMREILRDPSSKRSGMDRRDKEGGGANSNLAKDKGDDGKKTE